MNNIRNSPLNRGKGSLAALGAGYPVCIDIKLHSLVKVNATLHWAPSFHDMNTVKLCKKPK